MKYGFPGKYVGEQKTLSKNRSATQNDTDVKTVIKKV